MGQNTQKNCQMHKKQGNREMEEIVRERTGQGESVDEESRKIKSKDEAGKAKRPFPRKHGCESMKKSAKKE